MTACMVQMIIGVSNGMLYMDIYFTFVAAETKADIDGGGPGCLGILCPEHADRDGERRGAHAARGLWRDR